MAVPHADRFPSPVFKMMPELAALACAPIVGDIAASSMRQMLSAIVSLFLRRRSPAGMLAAVMQISALDGDIAYCRPCSVITTGRGRRRFPASKLLSFAAGYQYGRLISRWRRHDAMIAAFMILRAMTPSLPAKLAMMYASMGDVTLSAYASSSAVFHEFTPDGRRRWRQDGCRQHVGRSDFVARRLPMMLRPQEASGAGLRFRFRCHSPADIAALSSPVIACQARRRAPSMMFVCGVMAKSLRDGAECHRNHASAATRRHGVAAAVADVACACRAGIGCQYSRSHGHEASTCASCHRKMRLGR